MGISFSFNNSSTLVILTFSISTSPKILFKVPLLYKHGFESGAVGGKLLGAGFGGYVLFFVNPQDMPEFRRAVKNYGILDFKFTDKGVETW